MRVLCEALFNSTETPKTQDDINLMPRMGNRNEYGGFHKLGIPCWVVPVIKGYSNLGSTYLGKLPYLSVWALESLEPKP